MPRDAPPSVAPVVGDVKEDEEVNEKPEANAPISKNDFTLTEEKENTQTSQDSAPEVVVSEPPPEIAAPAPTVAPVPRVAAMQSHSAANSRAGSPVPLEALILDRSRSRRPANAHAGTLTPRSATPSRGGRFKSGPLGVVVAEQLRMTSSTAKPSRGETTDRTLGDERAGENIPDSKDKEGPDKPSEV